MATGRNDSAHALAHMDDDMNSNEEFASNASGSEDEDDEALEYKKADIKLVQGQLQRFLDSKTKIKSIPKDVLRTFEKYYDFIERLWDSGPTSKDDKAARTLDKKIKSINSKAGRNKLDPYFPWQKVKAFIGISRDMLNGMPIVQPEERKKLVGKLLFEQAASMYTLQRLGVDLSRIFTQEAWDDIEALMKDPDAEKDEAKLVQQLFMKPTVEQAEIFELAVNPVKEFYELFWDNKFDDLGDYILELQGLNKKLDKINEKLGEGEFAWTIPVDQFQGILDEFGGTVNKSEPSEPSRSQPTKSSRRRAEDTSQDLVPPTRSRIRMIFPGLEDGITEYGKVVLVRRVGCGWYVFVNAGTDDHWVYKLYSSADFPRGFAQKWHENPRFRSEVQYDEPCGKEFEIIDFVGVERDEEAEMRPRKTSRAPPSYAVGYMDGTLTLRTKSWTFANGGRANVRDKLEMIIDDRIKEEHYLTQMREKGLHPDTRKRLNPTDQRVMPWLFPSRTGLVGLKGLPPPKPKKALPPVRSETYPTRLSIKRRGDVRAEEEEYDDDYEIDEYEDDGYEEDEQRRMLYAAEQLRRLLPGSKKTKTLSDILGHSRRR